MILTDCPEMLLSISISNNTGSRLLTIILLQTTRQNKILHIQQLRAADGSFVVVNPVKPTLRRLRTKT